MNLFKLFIKISSITFISRLFGFIRDTIIAYIFGIGNKTDSFFISFKIPNAFKKTFSENTIYQTFVPILIKKKKNKKDLQKFISNSIGLIIIIVGIITVLYLLNIKNLIKILAPGFLINLKKYNLTLKISKITTPYLIIISITSFINSILYSWKYFTIISIMPILLNLVIIIFILLFFVINKSSILVLAWSVIFGSILQLIIQLKYLNKIKISIFPKFNIFDKDIKMAFKKLFLISINSIILQSSGIINIMFISLFISGSISWSYYADRLIDLPVGVLGVTITVILLPLLTKNNFFYKNKNVFNYGLKLGFLFSIPSSIAIMILSKPIIITLFQYGKFSYFDTIMTSKIVKSYSISIIGNTFVKILTTNLYSKNDVNTPILMSIITLLFSQLINLFIIKKSIYYIFYISLSISSCINALLLFYKTKSKYKIYLEKGWINFFLKIILSSITMSLVLFIMLNFVTILEKDKIFLRFLKIIFLIFIGISTYLITLFTTKIKL
ncbi:MAG: murein biosynthesis integral membrane protein MurJ [Enterobacteriaceae bacterium]